MTRAVETSAARVEGDASYTAAGVDIDAGDRAVELLRETVGTATRPEVRGGIGGFAGLFEFDLARWRRPVLASSTDGVGTKLAIAQAMDRHDTVGIDLVAMVVDDLVVCGAEPLFLQDYIACGQVVPERIETIVSGVAAGCVQAGCALLGGETAEHPGVMDADAYDLAATGVGVVEADGVLGADRVQAGDAIIAMASSGLHSNGYSLVRHVLLRSARLALDETLPELDAPLGEVLLTPTRIYALDCLALIRAVEVHAFAHITGGGLAGNVARVLPEGLEAVLDRGTWRPSAIFDVVRTRGGVDTAEMERTFNQGVGMVALVAGADADRAVTHLRSHDVDAWQVGEVVSGANGARLTGTHPA